MASAQVMPLLSDLDQLLHTSHYHAIMAGHGWDVADAMVEVEHWLFGGSEQTLSLIEVNGP